MELKYNVHYGTEYDMSSLIIKDHAIFHFVVLLIQTIVIGVTVLNSRVSGTIAVSRLQATVGIAHYLI